jgi:hypothetical protein
LASHLVILLSSHFLRFWWLAPPLGHINHLDAFHLTSTLASSEPIEKKSFLGGFSTHMIRWILVFWQLSTRMTSLSFIPLKKAYSLTSRFMWVWDMLENTHLQASIPRISLRTWLLCLKDLSLVRRKPLSGTYSILSHFLVWRTYLSSF